jgi:hypothetical protein
LHFVERTDLLHRHLLRDVVFGQPLSLQVGTEHLAVLVGEADPIEPPPCIEARGAPR